MTAAQIILEILEAAEVEVSTETQAAISGCAALNAPVDFCMDVMSVDYVSIKEVIGEWEVTTKGESLKRIAIMAAPLSLIAQSQPSNG